MDRAFALPAGGVDGCFHRAFSGGLDLHSEPRNGPTGQARTQAKRTFWTDLSSPCQPTARTTMTMDPQHLRMAEALLFAAAAPLDDATLVKRLTEGVDLSRKSVVSGKGGA